MRGDGRDLLGEELSVGGVGAALAEAEAAVAAAAGGRDPMGNPSFHCSNISSAFLPDPFLPGGDKDPVRATRQAGGIAGAGGGKKRCRWSAHGSRDRKCTRVGWYGERTEKV